MTTDASLPLQPPPPPGFGGAIEQSPPWVTAPWIEEPLVRRLPESIASRALIAAIAAGLLAQWLFAFEILGLNFPIWIAVVLAAAWRFRPKQAEFDRLDAWMPAAALTFAVFVALRADMMLIAFDLLAAGVLTLASVVAFGGKSATRAAWQAVVGLGARAGAVFWVGAVYLLPGIKPIAAAFDRRAAGRWMPYLRGLAIALPLLLIFGALFAAADAIFQAQLQGLFTFDFEPEIGTRIFLAAIASWLFAGTLACAWIAYRSATRPSTAVPAEAMRIGPTEGLVVLLALDAMFAVFVALQAAYLFGGLDTFAVSGMTYSDYARRGFFELIIVAALAGLVIIVLDRLVFQRGTAYRVAAAGLAAMTGVVVLSAFVRLGLYQAAYGWTELRFYALAAICWLAIGVALTLAAVLANRARWLPQLVVGAGLAVAIVCNVVGPQVFVTEQNLERALHPELVAPGGFSGLDTDYFSQFGFDAIPALVAARDQLPPEDRAAIGSVLSRAAIVLGEQQAELDWPSWNLARQRAADALEAAGYIAR